MARKQRRGTLTWTGFATRWVASIGVVLATFNPAGRSYFHWVRDGMTDALPFKLLVGALLFGAWAMFLRATARSLGRFGSAVVIAIIALLLWVLIDADIIPQDQNVLTWVGLIAVATFLAIGMTGSFLWRRLTGQYDVDSDDGLDE